MCTEDDSCLLGQIRIDRYIIPVYYDFQGYEKLKPPQSFHHLLAPIPSFPTTSNLPYPTMSLSFEVSLPSNAHAILDFLTFCRKHNILFPQGYNLTTVGNIYLRALSDITPTAFLNAHGKDVEILDHMVFVQEEVTDHWESEFICFEPDHPEVADMLETFMKSKDLLRQVKAFRDAVLNAEENSEKNTQDE